VLQLKIRLDLIGSVIALLFGVAIMSVGFITGAMATTEMGGGAVLASVVYIIVRRVSHTRELVSPCLGESLALILNIVFVVTITWSFWLLNSSVLLPPLYFGLIVLSVVIVTAQIMGSNNARNTGWLLLRILVIAACLRIGLYYEQPGFIGNDAWFHGAVVNAWMDTGFITPAIPTVYSGHTGYTYFPFMHLDIMAVQMVTGLNLKNSFFVSVVGSNILIPLFVYLMVFQIIDRRSGLLAALFISISLPMISWAVTPIPTSFGLAIYTVMMCLLCQKVSILNWALLRIVAISLVYTHTVSAFIFFTVLVFLLIGSGLYGRFSRTGKALPNATSAFLLIFALLMFGRWVSSSTADGIAFFDTVAAWFVQALFNQMQFVGSVVHVASNSTLNRTWFLIFEVLLILGVLSFLKYGSGRPQRIPFLTAVIGLSIITFTLPFFNNESLIPGRWVPFITVISAPVLVEGILALGRIPKTGKWSVTLVAIVVATFSFFSINSSLVNVRAPFLSEPAKIAFSQGELRAANTVSTKYSGPITTDWEFAELVFRTQTDSQSLIWLDPEIPPMGVVVVREYIVNNPQALEYNWRPGKPTLEDTATFLSQFDGTDYALIFDNGDVRVYRHTFLSGKVGK
jgi:hypothetical protein